MLRSILVLATLALALAAACGDDDGGGPTDTAPPATDTPTDAPTNAPDDGVIALQAVDFAFSEASLSAEVGSSVTVEFSNEGLATHTFTVDELEVDLLLSSDGSGTVDFTFPDESFEFYCRIHPSDMRGTLEPS